MAIPETLPTVLWHLLKLFDLLTQPIEAGEPYPVLRLHPHGAPTMGILQRENEEPIRYSLERPDDIPLWSDDTGFTYDLQGLMGSGSSGLLPFNFVEMRLMRHIVRRVPPYDIPGILEELHRMSPLVPDAIARLESALPPRDDCGQCWFMKRSQVRCLGHAWMDLLDEWRSTLWEGLRRYD